CGEADLTAEEPRCRVSALLYYSPPPDQLRRGSTSASSPASSLPVFPPPPLTSSLVTATLSLLVDIVVASPSNAKIPRTLVVYTPLSRFHRLLPPLGSAWSRCDTVLIGPGSAVLVLTQLVALAYSPKSDRWLKFSLNLPSKPRI
ncbi:hypothetical protein B296_00027344, partial [Ensete ventricosum]